MTTVAKITSAYGKISYLTVASSQALPGETWDETVTRVAQASLAAGASFILIDSSQIAILTNDLLNYANKCLAATADSTVGSISLTLSTGRVALIDPSAAGRTDILGLLTEAANLPSGSTITYYQSTGNLEVTAAEVQMIAAAAANFRTMALATWSQVVAAINANPPVITIYHDIDYPPSPIPAWPVAS